MPQLKEKNKFDFKIKPEEWYFFVIASLDKARLQLVWLNPFNIKEKQKGCFTSFIEALKFFQP